MILILDHRDSFPFNLAQAFQRLGAEARVQAATDHSAREVLESAPSALVLGPGPGGPSSARTSLEILAARPDLPILGICLGHQILALSEGARIERAPALLHGRTVELHHREGGLFTGFPSPLALTSYNSLVVAADSIPPTLELTAWTEVGTVLGVRHRELPYEGLQLHPESILSSSGENLLAAFLDRTHAIRRDPPRSARVHPAVDGARGPRASRSEP